jgi:hypothetical protein
VMVYNFWRTIKGDVREERAIGAPHIAPVAE